MTLEEKIEQEVAAFEKLGSKIVHNYDHGYGEEFRRTINEFLDKLPKSLTAIAQVAVEECEKKYNELLLAVVNKNEGETRHETALRYIRQAEQGSTQASSATPQKGEDR